MISILTNINKQFKNQRLNSTKTYKNNIHVSLIILINTIVLLLFCSTILKNSKNRLLQRLSSCGFAAVFSCFWLRFNNMFYMKVIELSANLGQELPYIVGLQTELPFGKRDLAQLAKNTKVFRCAQIGFDQGSRVVIPRKSSPKVNPNLPKTESPQASPRFHPLPFGSTPGTRKRSLE